MMERLKDWLDQPPTKTFYVVCFALMALANTATFYWVFG